MIPQKLYLLIEKLKSHEWMKSLIKNSKDVWLVGGIVRDAFLNKESKDVDLVIEGLDINKILSLLKSFGKANVEGESFAVIKFKPTGFKGEPYDIAIPRKDRKIGSGHKGFEVITDGISILEDLRRRDFTINSMAVNIDTGELLDPFNGLKDLNNKILKATDNKAFIEDALRMVRGIQFASRFGFLISNETMKLMKENSHLLKEISGERIFGELIKILRKKGDTNLALILLNKSGLDKALFDKKMDVFNEGFENLDEASFFYVLSILGNVNTRNFIKDRLKGTNDLVSDVTALDTIMGFVSRNIDEKDLLFNLFKIFNKNPKIMDAVILPKEVDDIILKMRSGKIPLNINDIPISGEDIKIMGNFKEGPEIGFIKEKIIRDALMNKFNWKSREDSINYLERIL